jgi:hypothetical protein
MTQGYNLRHMFLSPLPFFLANHEYAIFKPSFYTVYVYMVCLRALKCTFVVFFHLEEHASYKYL